MTSIRISCRCCLQAEAEERGKSEEIFEASTTHPQNETRSMSSCLDLLARFYDIFLLVPHVGLGGKQALAAKVSQ